MRLSLVFLTTVALVLLTSNPVSSAEGTLVASSERLSTGPESSVKHALQKRAGDDHDHDHDHPTPTSTAPTGTATAAPITSPEAPGHDHGHDDHDHDHDHESEHSESEDAHSHGPARTCDPHEHDEGEYVVWHHILALLIMMFVAALGCVIPMMIHDNPHTRFIVQLGKYFGAGVVLSVAFIHIMPEALFSLTHPCLSKAWTDDYPGYAPLIMMVSGLSMLVIEFLASSLVLNVQAQSKAVAAAAGSPGALEAQGHPVDNKSWHSHDNKDIEPAPSTSSDSNVPRNEQEDCHHSHGLAVLQCGPGISTKVSTYMLEIGIALHSVFIGIALGVLSGPEFLAMTIAICFHQFFEGIALGSRIADLTFQRKLVPVLLVVAFALVTPFGMAIGMGIQSTYKSNSVENLITMGVFDSIACGVLLYTAYVTLLGGDILFSERFRAEARANKASYLVAVWLGATAMAVLALWA
ncbi:MAG: ZIP zinc transporter-domain-containing protein [Benniella sp.]|nr:MAG: ZIP zinc transporter-domain-containing protein [Benniella sp.]